MIHPIRRHVGASSLLAVALLVVVGSIVACTASEKTDEPSAAAASSDIQVVVTPTAPAADEKAGDTPAPQARTAAGPTFAAYYHPRAASHLKAMEAGLKPLEAIPALDD